MKCPNCPSETRYILQHISKSRCQITVDLNDFKMQLKTYKEKYAKEKKNTTDRQSRVKQRAKDLIKVKEMQNKWKKESIKQRNDVICNNISENLSNIIHVFFSDDFPVTLYQHIPDDLLIPANYCK